MAESRDKAPSVVTQGRLPCPHCSSSDGYHLYSDGHGYCFVCESYDPAAEGGGERAEARPRAKGLATVERYSAIAPRKLSEETCRLFSYGLGTVNGRAAQIAPYFDPKTGDLIAQKIRHADKTMYVLGEGGKLPLFGQNLWRDGGKKVVITEGEIDAMSMSQAMGNRWPVVSVPNGAQSAAQALKRQLEWLERFDEIVLMFDMDETGQRAARECAELFTPGKCKLAHLPLKDPSEMLQAGRVKELLDAMWGAKEYRPDGIVNGADLLDLVLAEDDTMRFPYPWANITAATYGFKLSDVIVVTAGSGTGKTAFVSEISYDLGVKQGVKVGLLKLEEPIKRTAMGILGLHLNRRIHRRRPGETPSASQEELRKAYSETLANGNFYLYDHFGSTDSQNLLSRIRFLAKGCDCRVIVLDHISIAVSGSEEEDERRMLDRMMTNLKTIAVECNVTIFVVSHLRRPEGDRGHEDGAITRLGQLRGSHAIGQLADMVIGLERNQQSEEAANVTTVRILKDRDGGDTGLAGKLQYNKETGRLEEALDNDVGGF